MHKKVVKIICDGIAPLYISDLKRGKASSHVIEEIKATQ